MLLSATTLCPTCGEGPWTYEYDEAFKVGGLGVFFTTVGGLLWLVDGALFCRGELYVLGGEVHDYAAFETHEWWVTPPVETARRGRRRRQRAQ